MATSTLGSKKPSKISRTKNVEIKLPKIFLTKDILGNLRATFLQSWVIFAFFYVLGVVGHRGLYNRSRFFVSLKFARGPKWVLCQAIGIATLENPDGFCRTNRD